MDLTKLVNRSQKSGETYWSLVIEPGWVQAAIWQIDELQKAAVVVAIGISTRWETQESLLDATDTALSSAIQKYSGEEETEPSKTVFGVPAPWVSEGQIKKEYLEVIRNICGKLSLEPAGFVILPEAIAYYIKSEEQTPLNGVVIGLGTESVDVTVFNLGNLSGTATVAKSLSVVDDVVEGLSRFSMGDPLPSRFLIYDGKEGQLEDARQSLVTTDWTEAFAGKVRVLHVPKIEIVNVDKKVLAVCLAGAAEIANVSSIFTESLPGNTTNNDDIEVEKTDNQSPEIENVKEVVETPKFEDDNLTGLDAGFSEDPQQAEQSQKKMEFEPEPVITKKKNKFNFSKVLNISKKVIGKTKNLPHPQFIKPKISGLGGIGNRVKHIFSVGILVLMTLFVVGIAAWWFIPKATVTIYVVPKRLETRQDVNISPTANVSDLSTQTLAARMENVSVSGNKTMDTTGTKVVGEKSKGSVSIRNGTPIPIKLDSGAVLLSSNSLRFVLQDAITVPEASSPTNPGTATVSVVADNIGSDYNLSKDEVFKVSNYPKSDVDAIADSDFSGGSSRQISAVSKDDRTALQKNLTAELLDNATTELMTNISDERVLVSESLISTPQDVNFGNKEGDEASSLKLDMTIKVTALTLDKKDILEAAKAALASQTPTDYSIPSDKVDTKFEFDQTQLKKNVYKGKVTFSALLVPKVNVDSIRSAIVGKYQTPALSYITSLPGYSRAVIRFKPGLPSSLATLPHVAANITIDIVADK